MSNLRIIYNNIADDYSDLSMVSGVGATGYPLTFFTNDNKSKTWRSTNLSTQRIKITWASAQSISGVALAYTNLIQGSTFSVTLYSAAIGGTTLYSSGAISVGAGYSIPRGFTSIGAASFAYGGGVNVAAFFGLTANVLRMEIELTSPSNPDNYIEIGRLIAGQSITTERDVAEGVNVGFIDSTTSKRTSSGNYITDRGTISRTLDFNLNAFNAADKAILNNLFRSVGRSQPIYASIVPTGAINEDQLATQIYGKLDQDLVINYPYYQRYNASLRIVEL